MFLETLLPPAATMTEAERRGRTVAPPPSDPVLPVPTRLAAGWYTWCKPAFEFLFALTLLVLAAPVIVVTALLVKLTSRGPAFYSQVRLGKDGRPFLIY